MPMGGAALTLSVLLLVVLAVVDNGAMAKARDDDSSGLEYGCPEENKVAQGWD
jgi:hypothetical protein